MSTTEKTILKYNNRKQKVKIKLTHCAQTRQWFIYQNNFKARYNKLSAAIITFEDLVFTTFQNRLTLAENTFTNALKK